MELFKEIGPDYDPYKMSDEYEMEGNGMKNMQELYDLNQRIEKLGNFLEIRKNKIENHEALEPVCADRKVSYYLNADV
jgi:hypothetical protein